MTQRGLISAACVGGPALASREALRSSHASTTFDIRRSFIIAWYRDDRNVQALLPKLSTYVGHKDVACTQQYLRLIPELLNEASRRFATHAREVYNHA